MDKHKLEKNGAATKVPSDISEALRKEVMRLATDGDAKQWWRLLRSPVKKSGPRR